MSTACDHGDLAVSVVGARLSLIPFTVWFCRTIVDMGTLLSSSAGSPGVQAAGLTTEVRRRQPYEAIRQ